MAIYQVSAAQVNGYGPASDAYSSAQAQNIATPWATLDKAISVWVTGDSIVLNGETASPQVYTAASFFTLARSGGSVSCVQPRGAILRANGAQARVANIGLPAAATLTIQGIIFDAQSLSTRCVDTSSNQFTLVYDNCQFMNGVTDLARNNSGTASILYKNCEVTGNGLTMALNNSSMTTGFVDVDNIYGNIGMAVNLGGAVYAQSTAQGATLRVKIGALKQTNGANNSAAMVTPVGIENCEVFMLGETGPEAILDGAANAGPAIVNIRGSAGIVQRAPLIHHLRVANLCGVGGYDVLVGSDSSAGAGSDYTISQMVIKHCRSRGLASNTTRHGYIVGWQNGGIIDDCIPTQAYITAIFKECKGDTYILDNTVSLGVNGGNAGGLYSKGNQNGSVIALNKVLLTTGNLNLAINCAYNSTSGTIDNGSKVIGNSIWSNDVVSKIASVGSSGVPADTSTAKFVLNNYSLAGVSGTPWTVGSATTYTSLAAWGAAQEVTYSADVPTLRTPSFFATRVRPIAVAALSQQNAWIPPAMGI